MIKADLLFKNYFTCNFYIKEHMLFQMKKSKIIFVFQNTNNIQLFYKNRRRFYSTKCYIFLCYVKTAIICFTFYKPCKFLK